MLETELVPAPENDSRQLMVVLHGLGDSMEGYRWLPPALGMPRLNYLLVNAPDFYYGGYSWYDFADDAAPGILRSRALLFDLLDEQRNRGFPSEETMLFGFSQGSLMTMEAGLRYPHRFAGLIGISGYVHGPENAIRELSPVALQQRFLVTHGIDDPLIPFAEVREQINLLKAEGLHIEWHEFVKPHTIAGEEELDVIRSFVRNCYSAHQ
ncbi:MAG TPA: serine esterase [Verrucomicrobiae bacterium]|nr:serine esterase [Verrucomicrobiae bacterium]